MNRRDVILNKIKDGDVLAAVMPALSGSYPVRTVRYRIRYWWRKFMREFCGICPDCNTVLNFTTTGRGLCPKCGK